MWAKVHFLTVLLVIVRRLSTRLREQHATATTAKYISEATGLKIDRLMAGDHGGEQQLTSRIAYNEIDVLLFFRDTRPSSVNNAEDYELLRVCDQYNIPVATNIAMAEVVITALDRGDLDWREIVNPHSAYNMSKAR